MDFRDLEYVCSITNHVKIPVFHFFGKVNKQQLKMVSANY